MTPVEIAYFKHFLFDKSIERSFVSYYRKYRIKGSEKGDRYGNPESIEQYFLKTTVKDVIMKAFTFYPTNSLSRSNFTYDYWKDIDDKWQEYMKQNENNWTNESWPNLRKTFAILRQNWDLSEYWKRDNLESTEEVYRRMNIHLPLPENRWEHGYAPKKNEEMEQSDEQQIVNDFVGVPEADAQAGTEIRDPLAGFEFFEEERPQFMRLMSNEISLNFNSGSFKVTFNMPVSNEIEKAGMEYVRLAKNKSGDICLILNRVLGSRLSKSSNKNKFNTTLNSKDICTKIRTLLNIKPEYSILNIEKLTSTSDYLIFKVTKS